MSVLPYPPLAPVPFPQTLLGVMCHHDPNILLRAAIYRRLLGAEFRVALILKFDLLLDALELTSSAPLIGVDAGENKEDEVQNAVLPPFVSIRSPRIFNCD